MAKGNGATRQHGCVGTNGNDARSRKSETSWSRRLVHRGAVLLTPTLLGGCSVTSPHWGYVPDSTSAPVPVQAWTSHTGTPVVVECATATNAHGSPYPDESAYIVAATIPVSAAASLDSEGTAMHTASASVTFPAACWDYFGDYDFWQINLRVSQVVPALGGGTTRRIFSSFDRAGLECLGRENGAAASWFGFLGKGCEKTYLGETEQIPYIVLRIDGYAAGAASASAPTPAAVKKKNPALVAADKKQRNAPKVTPIVPLTANEVQAFKEAAAERRP